jgi:hypothetical protein
MNTNHLSCNSTSSLIRAARLEQSAALGELIASGIIATLKASERAARWLAHLVNREPQPRFSAPLPSPFASH